MSRTQLQVFLVLTSAVVAFGGLLYALDPEGSTVGGLTIVAAMLTQIAGALQREKPRRDEVVDRS